MCVEQIDEGSIGGVQAHNRRPLGSRGKWVHARYSTQRGRGKVNGYYTMKIFTVGRTTDALIYCSLIGAEVVQFPTGHGTPPAAKLSLNHLMWGPHNAPPEK